MFKKPTKKQFIIRRVLYSSAATLAVIIIATFTILFMLGFRFNSDSGSLQQGALLQFDSRPTGADVNIDDTYIGSRTATKQTVVAGTHSVRMTLKGYQDWNRTLDLKAGTLTWLDYAILVPTNRPVQTVTTYETLVNASISPDNKWALAQEKADVAEFHRVDLRSEEVKTELITIPEQKITDALTEGVTHSFTIVSWDAAGRYVLVKHNYKDTYEWIVMDTQDGTRTENITQVFSVGIKDIKFSGSSGEVFYVLTDEGTIRKLDLGPDTISRSFVTHVESFSLFDNKVVSYVGLDAVDATKRVAGVYREGDQAPHILHTTTTLDSPVKIATAQYFGDYYFAIGEGSIVTVLTGDFPSSSSEDAESLKEFVTLDLVGAVSALSFSPAGDFVLAQSGESFKSYELEHKRTDMGVVKAAQGTSASSLKWLDGAHLWNDDGGMLMMRDFNGNNVFEIMNVERGFDASFSQNGRFFYGIGKSDEGFHLQRVKMIL
ncbi:MAG: PEGA domain-containing protein [Candidatus Microsaccharimonas sp.]